MAPSKEGQSPTTTSNRAAGRAAVFGNSPETTNNGQDRIIRKPETQAITGLHPSTIRRLEIEGRFPKRIRLGGSACGWLLSEINAWLAERAAARV